MPRAIAATRPWRQEALAGAHGTEQGGFRAETANSLPIQSARLGAVSSVWYIDLLFAVKHVATFTNLPPFVCIRVEEFGVCSRATLLGFEIYALRFGEWGLRFEVLGLGYRV